MALKILDDAYRMYGATSDEGQTLLGCIQKLGKLAQPGDVSSAGQMNGLQQQMLKAMQNAQAQRAMAQQSPEAGGQKPPAPAGA
jgi:hypothetical protein